MAEVLNQRRLRLNPGPVGTELWMTVEPSAAIRCRSTGVMSPEVASTRTSYEDRGFWEMT